MDNRKRPRMEASNGTIDDDGTTVTTIGGPSIFLSNSDAITDAVDLSGALPPNLFFTICDENSNESQDYLTINTDDEHVKQEHVECLQTPTLTYRILSQLQRQVPVCCAPMPLTNTTTVSAHNSPTAAVLPASVQLPSGCEIYLVQTPATTTRDIAVGNELQLPTSFNAAAVPTKTTIKLEPDAAITTNTSCVGVGGSGGGDVADSGARLMCGGNVNTSPITTSKIKFTKAAAGTIAKSMTTARDNNNGKGSFILEAYKLRDDKRRATHNEVERRRRDRINSWILKLKEMLPAEMPTNTTTTTTIASTNSATSKTYALAIAAVNSNGLPDIQQQQQQQQTQQQRIINNNPNNLSRSPLSDSKSQILIKACEYIQIIKDENKSLRECLTENQELRLQNESLKSELNKLKSERSSGISNPNRNFNLTLNSLNAKSYFDTSASTTTTPIIGSVNNTNGVRNNNNLNAFTKRELIIRDYVD